MAYRDRKSPKGLWLKSYTWCGTNGKTRAGKLWNNLETRTTAQSHKDLCYDGAINGFTDFQEFAGWCQTQEGYLNTDTNGYFWQLDKDILAPDSKLYSPENCVFVPNKINSLFMDQPSEAGWLKGVTQNLDNSPKFVARCRDIDGVKRHLGTFDTELRAHQEWYSYKRTVIGMVLKEYKLADRAVEALKARWDL